MSFVIKSALSWVLFLGFLTPGLHFPPQQVDRLVDWLSGPAGENVQVVSPGMGKPYEPSPIKALELVGLTTAGKPIRVGQKFPAAADWVAGLSFRLKNTSGKTMHAIWLDLILPETQVGESRLWFRLEYGKRQSGGYRLEEPPILPGEVIEVKVRENQYQNGLESYAGKSPVTRISRAVIGNIGVTWEDGTLWMTGWLPTGN